MLPVLLLSLHILPNVYTKPIYPLNPLERALECHLSPDAPPKVYHWVPENPVNLWELAGRFQGDLVGLPSQEALSRQQRCVLKDGVNYWPEAIVPVDFGRGFGWKDLKVLKKALGIIEEKTCIRFPPRQDNDTSYVELKGDLGYGECWSYLGQISGNQTLSLGEGCVNLHHALHEICHALGLVHQHSAPDRDDYINIHWENIDPDFVEWFDKYTWNEYTDFGLGYDYYSVMHYSAYIATKNGKPTISAKDPKVKIEERTTLSEKDVKKLNMMYCSGDAYTGQFNYRTFGGRIVDLVDDLSPFTRHMITFLAAVWLLLMTSLLGKWMFSRLLFTEVVPDKFEEGKAPGMAKGNHMVPENVFYMKNEIATGKEAVKKDDGAKRNDLNNEEGQGVKSNEIVRRMESTTVKEKAKEIDIATTKEIMEEDGKTWLVGKTKDEKRGGENSIVSIVERAMEANNDSAIVTAKGKDMIKKEDINIGKEKMKKEESTKENNLAENRDLTKENNSTKENARMDITKEDESEIAKWNDLTKKTTQEKDNMNKDADWTEEDHKTEGIEVKEEGKDNELAKMVGVTGVNEWAKEIDKDKENDVTMREESTMWGKIMERTKAEKIMNKEELFKDETMEMKLKNRNENDKEDELTKENERMEMKKEDETEIAKYNEMMKERKKEKIKMHQGEERIKENHETKAIKTIKENEEGNNNELDKIEKFKKEKERAKEIDKAKVEEVRIGEEGNKWEEIMERRKAEKIVNKVEMFEDNHEVMKMMTKNRNEGGKENSEAKGMVTNNNDEGSELAKKVQLTKNNERSEEIDKDEENQEKNGEKSTTYEEMRRKTQRKNPVNKEEERINNNRKAQEIEPKTEYTGKKEDELYKEMELAKNNKRAKKIDRDKEDEVSQEEERTKCKEEKLQNNIIPKRLETSIMQEGGNEKESSNKDWLTKEYERPKEIEIDKKIMLLKVVKDGEETKNIVSREIELTKKEERDKVGERAIGANVAKEDNRVPQKDMKKEVTQEQGVVKEKEINKDVEQSLMDKEKETTEGVEISKLDDSVKGKRTLETKDIAKGKSGTKDEKEVVEQKYGTKENEVIKGKDGAKRRESNAQRWRRRNENLLPKVKNKGKNK